MEPQCIILADVPRFLVETLQRALAAVSRHITLQWVEPRAQTIDDFSMPELVALLTSPPPMGMQPC